MGFFSISYSPTIKILTTHDSSHSKNKALQVTKGFHATMWHENLLPKGTFLHHGHYISHLFLPKITISGQNCGSGSWT
jgi:hypothetical protein